MLWFAGVVAVFLVTLACGSCVASIVLDGAGGVCLAGVYKYGVSGWNAVA
jgi:hypothetical protein